MDSVEFRGDPGDLERFAQRVLKQTVAIDALSPFEHRMRWAAGGTSGFSSATELRSGLKISATKLSWDAPWAFQFRDTASPLKFMLGRGAGPRVTSLDGSSHSLGEGVLQVRHATQAVDTTCAFTEGGAGFEQLSLEVEPERLKELLGAAVLPRPLELMLASTASQSLHEQPIIPAFSRLLEEILYADARGPARQLLLEAKGLELLAVMVDELELVSKAMAPLGRRDVERLERARRVLLERIDAPPSLPELARRRAQRVQAQGGVSRAVRRFGVRLPEGTADGARTAALGSARAQRHRDRSARGLRQPEQVRERVPQALRRPAFGAALSAVA